MTNKSPPRAVPSQSANDNGPLSPGQVRVLKIAIAVMGAMIVASLIAIVARVIYLSTTSKTPPKVPASAVSRFASEVELALPRGATVRSMALEGNRLLVYYVSPAGNGAAIVDLTNGTTISQVRITEENRPK